MVRILSRFVAFKVVININLISFFNVTSKVLKRMKVAVKETDSILKLKEENERLRGEISELKPFKDKVNGVSLNLT
jgi:hypothetical protein